MLKTWQYNGVAPWQDIIQWCEAHIKGHYDHNGFEKIYFEEAAYTLFVLRWK